MYFFIQSSPDNDINIILKHCNKRINNDSEQMGVGKDSMNLKSTFQ